MYASVVTTQMRAGMLEEAINIYKSSIVPAIQIQPGFKGATLLVNADTNIGVSTTIWETKAEMLAGEASGYLQSEFAKLGSFLKAPPANAHYEVSVQISN